MAEELPELPDLTSLEGHTFVHNGQPYTVVIATATRRPIAAGATAAAAPVHLDVTVTTPARPAPIGVGLDLDSQKANDPAFVRAALEQSLGDLMDHRHPPASH